MAFGSSKHRSSFFCCLACCNCPHDFHIFGCLRTEPFGHFTSNLDFSSRSGQQQARDIFNAGMLRYKAALEHYLLDGCVTEHCNIVMEISNMYR